MTRRWKPPRWAKPMKREQKKDEVCEAIIRCLMGKRILEEEKKTKNIDELFEAFPDQN